MIASGATEIDDTQPWHSCWLSRGHRRHPNGDLRFDRSTEVDQPWGNCPLGPSRQVIGNLFVCWPIEHDPDRPFIIVLKQEDDRSVEVGIEQPWGGYQELAGEGFLHGRIVADTPGQR